MIRNVHERAPEAPLDLCAPLIDALASSEDLLWPGDRWPRLRLDRPIGVGAVGGHGPVPYEVAAYDPGRGVVFRFHPRFGLRGHYGFELLPRGELTVMRNVLEGRAVGWMRILWPLAFQWLHDALIEDALDRAEAFASGRAVSVPRWSPWVRLLRSVLGRTRLAGRRPTPAREGS